MLVFACRCAVILDYFTYSGKMVRLWSRAEETPLSDKMMRIHPDALNRFSLKKVMAWPCPWVAFSSRIIHLLNMLQWAIAVGPIVLRHIKTALEMSLSLARAITYTAAIFAFYWNKSCLSTEAKYCADYTINQFKFAQYLQTNIYIVGKSSVIKSSPVLLYFIF